MNLTLIQLNNLVRQTIEYSMPRSYWVEAELLDCHEGNGHCYMELVQKDEYSNTPVAKAKANCWRSTWMKLRPRFENITGQRLHAGMKGNLPSGLRILMEYHRHRPHLHDGRPRTKTPRDNRYAEGGGRLRPQ